MGYATTVWPFARFDSTSDPAYEYVQGAVANEGLGAAGFYPQSSPTMDMTVGIERGAGNSLRLFSVAPVDVVGAMTQGIGDSATGTNASAQGTATTAAGEGAHAEGVGAIAYLRAGHAEGESTVANGIAAHAEGSACVADGDASHAEGQEVSVAGWASHGEGYQTMVDGADFAHVEGQTTYVSGVAAHAEGQETFAFSEAGHAEGLRSVAEDVASHAEGIDSDAVLPGSHASASGCWQSAGDAQCSSVVLRGSTPGLVAGESVELLAGSALEGMLYSWDQHDYLLIVECVAASMYARASFRQSFLCHCTQGHIGHPGTLTIVAVGTQENLASTLAATWTLTASIGASPRRFKLVFGTGLATIATVQCVCNVRVVETLWIQPP